MFMQRSRRRNSCTVILLFLLDCLHYYFSLYICSIGRYYTENMLSFTLNIMLTDSLLLTNTTIRMLTILIANILTLGIIRTVDIFTMCSASQLKRKKKLEYLPRKQCESQFQDHDNSFEASSTYLSSITPFVVFHVLCGVNVCDFLFCNLTIDFKKKHEFFFYI